MSKNVKNGKKNRIVTIKTNCDNSRGGTIEFPTLSDLKRSDEAPTTIPNRLLLKNLDDSGVFFGEREERIRNDDRKRKMEDHNREQTRQWQLILIFSKE